VHAGFRDGLPLSEWDNLLKLFWLKSVADPLISCLLAFVPSADAVG